MAARVMAERSSSSGAADEGREPDPAKLSDVGSSESVVENPVAAIRGLEQVAGHAEPDDHVVDDGLGACEGQTGFGLSPKEHMTFDSDATDVRPVL